MRTKEEYYEDTLKNQGLAGEPGGAGTAVVLTAAANGTGSAANV